MYTNDTVMPARPATASYGQHGKSLVGVAAAGGSWRQLAGLAGVS